MKPNRPRVIGDPLKKFKRPSVIQECHPGMKKHLEKLMEEDHRAGRAFGAALMVSSRSGMPDQWFFEKARALGYKFDDEKAFWEHQCDRLKKEKKPPKDKDVRLEERLVEFEKVLRRNQGDDAFEKTAVTMSGSIEQWRIDMKSFLMEEIKDIDKMCEELVQKGHTRPL